MQQAAAIVEPAAQAAPYYRHRLPVRLMHWANAAALAVLLMSGLQIFNAHPHLYWGKSSYSGATPLLSIEAREAPDGRIQGVARVLGHEFDTTGVLGASRAADGAWVQRGFPEWATLPGPYSLSASRGWHFLAAWVLVVNGLAYVLWSAASRHLARDLVPTGADLRGIGGSIRDHVRFRHPTGEAARRYNVLQKLAYLAVIFALLPLVVLTGWAMSPWLDALWPGWVDWLGGRQAARTIHFVVAWLLVAFVLVHVFEVIVSGPLNHMRSMITGWYRTPGEHAPSVIHHNHTSGEVSQ